LRQLAAKMRGLEFPRSSACQETSMRILIAEDDQVLADGLLRSLRASGAAVDHVASGTEADAALLANNEFDLLILDLGLPRMHGQAGRVATIDGRMVELSARELGLLEVLLQRAGRLVSKDQLVERLCEWGEEVSNNAIEVYIHRLRKKIEKGPIRIATVRG